MWGRCWWGGGPWPGEGLLLPPAQLQPQRHVIRNTCGDRGRGWGLICSSSPELVEGPGNSNPPHQSFRAELQTRANQGSVQNKAWMQHLPDTPKGKSADLNNSVCCATSHHRCGLTSAPHSPPLPPALARSQ